MADPVRPAEYVAVCQSSWPVGWEQCSAPHPEGVKCILYLGHVGQHRYWRGRKGAIDWDSGTHRKEWA